MSRTVSASSANVALAQASTSQTVMVTSAPGGAIAFIKFGGSSAVSAALTDTPILPGGIYVFTIGNDVTHVAAIGTSGTIYFTTGMGA